MKFLPWPLLLLLYLRGRASVRRVLRMAARPKGLVVLLVWAVLIFFMLLPGLMTSGKISFAKPPQSSPEKAAELGPSNEEYEAMVQQSTARHAAPVAPRDGTKPAPSDDPSASSLWPDVDSITLGALGVVALLLLSLVGKPADRTLVFTRGEVDLLFPAPFTRSQLLRYAMAKWFLPLMAVALFFSVVTKSLANWWLAVFLGILLLLWFLNLFAVCAAFIQLRMGQDRFRVLRNGLYVAAILAAGVGAWWVARAMQASGEFTWTALLESPVARALALPGLPFAQAIGAADIASFAPWGLLALAINGGLFIAALGLNANWLEQGAESSARLAAKLEQARKTGGMGPGKAKFAALQLPMPARAGGIGPLAWRQLVTGTRRSAGGLWLVLILVAGALVPVLFVGQGEDGVWKALRPLLLMAVGYISLFLPQMLQIDFRGDLDRLDLLKSLPVSAWTVAVAQVLPCALVVTVLQTALGLMMLGAFGLLPPALPLWILVLLAFNIMSVGLENVAFLLWPHRFRQGTGMGMASPQVVLQMLRVLVLMVLAGLAAGAALAAALLLDGPTRFWAAAGAALVVLLAEAAAVLWVVAVQFRRLDPDMERVAE